jgi:hypothetical protein
MSHSEQDDVDFGYHSDDGVPAGRRRRRMVVGAAGLAALLGGGAFLVTQALTSKPAIVASESGARTSMAPPADAPSDAPSAPSPVTGRSVVPTPVPSVSSTNKSVEQEIRDARSAAAKDGVPLERPRVTDTATAADVRVTNSGSLKKAGRTLRVVSARGDLTGQRELGWVAGGARAYGDATCSQTVQFANSGSPRKVPNLLICWQTSATRSVVTVMVDVHGHPSREASVAALDKRWAELG